MLFISVCFGQDEAVGTKTAIGFQLTQVQNDFGLGFNISSPYFANERMTMRVRGNLVWHQHPDAIGESTWTSYSNFSFGIASISGVVAERIRLYGEGGAMVLFPAGDFSSESVNFGGYGLFGFEFFMYPHSNYFIELGGVGSGAKADRIPTAPIYSNGFIISVGYRYQF